MNSKAVKNILKGSSFINASFFTALASFTKIITSLILGKIIALKLGTEGMALFGQLLNFVTIASVIAGGAINQGIIKYVAEFIVTDEVKLKNVIATSFKTIIYCSSITGLILIFGCTYFAKRILHQESLYSIFLLFGLTIIFYSLNNFLLSVVNGYKEYKKSNTINILINCIGLFLSLLFIYTLDIYGALISVVLNQAFLFFITLYIVRNEKWMKKDFLLRKLDIELLKKLSAFALLAISSTALAPFVSIIIRNYIIDTISLESAGLYEFVIRVSGASILFFSLTISTYYLPKISEIQKKDGLIKEVKNTYTVLVPILAFILSIIYIFRFQIINLLASESFTASAELFGCFLMGVFFKIIAQVLSFIFIAKAKIKTALLLEVFFNFSYSILTISFIRQFGLIGTAYAYLLSYTLYFGILVYLFQQLLKKNYDT